jgi:DNA mismatch repair ATPase MutS
VKPKYLLFHRMGDFFELFFDDAKQYAAILDIALTSRGEHDGHQAMRTRRKAIWRGWIKAAPGGNRGT